MIYAAVLVSLLAIWAFMLFAQARSGRLAGVWASSYSWFVVIWVVQFGILLLPIYSYFDRFRWETAALILVAHLAFAAGILLAMILVRPPDARKMDLAGVENHRIIISAFSLVGAFSILLLSVNNLLASGVGLAQRMNSSKMLQARLETVEFDDYFLGPLFGPVNILASLSYVAIPCFFFYWGLGRPWTRRISIETIAIATTVLIVAINQVLISAGRMSVLFVILLMFIPVILARTLMRSRELALGQRRPKRRTRLTTWVILAVAAFGLTIASAVFQQFRGDHSDPWVTMSRGHRTTVAPWLYTTVRSNSLLGFYVHQTSYITTPVDVLNTYGQLPDAAMPGPFWGTYNFHVVYRNLFRYMPGFNPEFWSENRTKLFMPLRQLDREGNVWATLVRDLIADFGRGGAFAALFLLGFVSQFATDRFMRRPTGGGGALIAILRMCLLMSALISTFFLAWTVWAILAAFAVSLWPGFVRPSASQPMPQERLLRRPHWAR